MKKVLLYCVLILTLLSCEKSGDDLQPYNEETKFNIVLSPSKYVVPVVFHVDAAEDIPTARIQEVLTKCNKLFDNNNADIQFQISDIVSVDWYGITKDCEIFMETEDPNTTDLLWDTNKYVNIFLYEFTNSYILGISHVAFTSHNNALEGLTPVPYLYHSRLDYPRSLCINSEYITDKSVPGRYYPEDVVVTLAHELGHYIGLLHPFHEEDESCQNGDSDYCDDTQCYDRVNYLDNIPNSDYLDGRVVRISCSGDSYSADNIMDYSYCYSDIFTEDQKFRMQHVLQNSPLVPYVGKQTPSRSAVDSSIEVPLGIIMQ